MPTLQELKDYVGAGNADDAFLSTCLVEATALVARVNTAWDSFTGTYVVSLAPAAIVDRAIMECASELFHAKNAPNGVMQFAVFDGAPMRIARDPMHRARAILAPWVVFGL